ncbi:GNAT family N-acetyltransferase [Georgenia wangjunii]|uniref:GNAT family N-acetyltransferase n=1 Tax=Georgenia wangjunii TaxID=3117730 RepID=UPI002F26A589
MTYRTAPATTAVFDDVRTALAPKSAEATGCWCLSYRLPLSEHGPMTRDERAARLGQLCAATPAPGILAYDDAGEVVGWLGLAPRHELAAYARSARIPHVDDLAVWTVFCFKVRAGRRRRGVASDLLVGAVEYARSQGAPAIEGYPVDNDGARVDTTLASAGTRALFERAGFTKAADTTSTLAGFPRVVMRLALT